MSICAVLHFEGTANIVFLRYRRYEPVVRRQGLPEQNLERGFDSGETSLLGIVETNSICGVVDLQVGCELVSADYGEVFGEVNTEGALCGYEVSVAEEVHAIYISLNEYPRRIGYVKAKFRSGNGDGRKQRA